MAAAPKPKPTVKRKPVNPLTLVSGEGYAVEKFYTRSTNKHDHSRNVQTPYPQDQHSEIFRWANIVPEYRGSAQALVRDAVYHRLHWLAEQWQQEEGISDLELLTEQERIMEITTVRTRMVEDAERDLRKLLDAGETEMLEDSIAIHRKMLPRLGPVQRKRLAGIIDETERMMRLT